MESLVRPDYKEHVPEEQDTYVYAKLCQIIDIQIVQQTQRDELAQEARC